MRSRVAGYHDGDVRISTPQDGMTQRPETARFEDRGEVGVARDGRVSVIAHQEEEVIAIESSRSCIGAQEPIEITIECQYLRMPRVAKVRDAVDAGKDPEHESATLLGQLDQRASDAPLEGSVPTGEVCQASMKGAGALGKHCIAAQSASKW